MYLLVFSNTLHIFLNVELHVQGFSNFDMLIRKIPRNWRPEGTGNELKIGNRTNY